MSTEKHPNLLRHLAEEYRGLNGNSIEILPHPPSALEFARLVHISRPVLIQGFDIPALKRWSNDYLIEMMDDCPLSVAITPDGRADAIHRDRDGQLYFVEPFIQSMTMKDLLQEIETTSKSKTDVCYLQSQNGNLFSPEYFNGDREEAVVASELHALQNDVPSEVVWCSEALGKSPEAVNIWIGDSRSTTSIHSDPYENIYAVVRGAKFFTLIPPTDGWCLKERRYPHAQFNRSSPDAPLEIRPSRDDVPLVRWSSVSHPHLSNALPNEVRPIQVMVEPGQALYLPVGWWHHVRQSDETTIALNWWYDTEIRGMSWALLSVLRESDEVPLSNQPERRAAE